MRRKDLGLIGLAVLTVALVALTLLRTALPGTGVDLRDLPSGVETTPATADPARSTGEPVPTEDPDAPRPAGDPLGAARAVLASGAPVVVAALGDSTGNETWEWTYTWARDLGTDRPVTVVSWNEWTEAGYIEPRLVSDGGAGPAAGAVTIYSGHHTGARAGYVAEHAGALLPERPDLVLLNYGHNSPASEIAAELAGALDAVRGSAGRDVPVVVILQQPRLDGEGADVRDAVADWATQEGLGIVDVARAFSESGRPLADLLADPVHPNEAGTRIWADAVARALGPPADGE